jgi:hypothetical protein
MATYNTVIKKRNAANNGWDSILPITTAENVLINEQGDTVATHMADDVQITNAGQTEPPHGLAKCKINATTAPTVNDDSADGYSVNSVWIDTTNDKAYICLDATVGAAVWQIIGAGLIEQKLAQRDVSIAGVQTISGLLGKPKMIEIRANVGGTYNGSIGSWQENGGQSRLFFIKTAVAGDVVIYNSSAGAIALGADSNSYTTGTIQNVTAGSFEILWAKNASGGTGTANLQIILHY